MIKQAERTSSKQKDEYVSVEHLMLASFSYLSKALEALYAKHKLTKDAFLSALAKVKTQNVRTDNPEDTYDVLEKYGTDLVVRAREKRTDPVIGRDAEIRNVSDSFA